MKITKKQLRDIVRKTVRQKLSEDIGYADDFKSDELKKYLKDVDEFLKSTIEKAKQLHTKGEDLMRTNVLSSYEIQERNRYLLYCTGFLNNLVAALLTRIEELHRQ